MINNILKTAWRNLWAQRSYTLLNTIGLAIGLAGSLLIFLFIRHHLSVDRHHAKFDRTFRIVLDLHLDDGTVETYPEAPLPMAQTLRRDHPQVEQAAFLVMNRDLTVGINSQKKRTPTYFLEHDGTALVEPGLFQIFDYKWLAGNPKTALQAPNSIVLTQSWANRYFGSNSPIGQTIDLNHTVKATVTGIVADPIHPTDTHIGLFISMPTIRQLDPEFDVNSWGQLNSNYRLYVTLKSTDPASARQLEATFPALSKKQYGNEMAHIYQFHVQPLANVHFDVARVGGVIRRSLLGSLGLIGAFLVLIACINFTNLATAQAFRRSKEVGIRKTLGSSRGQLAGQFLLETSLIVGVATGLAVLLAWVSLPLFSNWVRVPISLNPDLTICLFISALILTIVVLAGGYPAFILSGFSPWASLRGQLTTTVGGYSLRKGLVVVQFVVCQVLLVGALVVMKQMQYIRQADLGFQQDNVLIINLPYDQKQSWQTFKNELNKYLGISSITLQYRPPSAKVMNGGSFKFESKTEWVKYPVRERLADADYLKTYNLRLLAGRNIVPGDSIREYVINETLLHKLGFSRPQDIIGKRMQYYLSAVPMPIVGVVRDFHQRSLHEPIGPCFIATFPNMYRQAGIRLTGPSSVQTLAHIRAVWQRLYPTEVFDYAFLDDQLAQFYETETTISQLTNTFALLAIVICGLGLYGLVAFTVGQRTKEIGIRKVLGASVAGIVVLLSRDVVKLVLVGIVLASPLAWWAMDGWLENFAYRINIGLWIFVLAGGLGLLIALLTVSYQSISAAMLDPVKTLRSE